MSENRSDNGLLVAVCSLFRNSADTLAYYRAVITAQERPGVRLAFSFVEGDSTDDTYDLLAAWAAEDDRVTLVQRSVEPVDDYDDRVRKWAELGNLALEGALATGADYVLWCESDLTLPFDLLPQLVADDRDIVAPAIFLGGLFYDSWGFRGLNGVKFTGEAPYHPDFRSHDLVELSSVGSCVLFRREIFDQGVRFRGVWEDGLLVGVCRDAARLGFRTFVDTRLAIVHPTTLWRGQQYTLERIEVDCADAANDVWAPVAQELAAEVTFEFGSLVIDGDHPVFEPAHAIVRSHVADRPYRLGVRLASHSRRTYVLQVEDLA